MALKPLNSVGGFSVGEIPANVILANADITANKGTFSGNLAVSNVNPAWGLLTDNLYYSNGVPWDLQQAAGSNTQIQFNNNNDFGASANFTWNTATDTLTVTGNANISGVINAGALANGTSNVRIPAVNGNVNISSAGNANVLVVTGTGANITGTANVTGNANVGNLGTGVVLASANITGANLISNANLTVNNFILTPGGSDLVFLPATSVTRNYGNMDPYTGGYYLGGGVRWTGVRANSGDFATTLNVTGNANVGNIGAASGLFTANITGSNATINLELQANTANFDGNVIMDNWLTVANTANVGNLRTNNLLYANGVPWDLQEAAGNNNEIQFNLNDNFSASANFTFDPSTNQFTVLGNGQFNNANLGNLATVNFVNVASNVITANLTVNTAITANTANFSGNVVAPNLTVNSAIVGNTANFSGNVVVPNLTVNLTLAGNTANFSGNVVAPNVTANATVFAANANVSGTTITNALTVNNAITGNTANFSGNVVVPNLTVNLQLAGNTANFTGNVVAANFTGSLANGNSNVKVYGNANVEVTVNGSANVATFTDTAFLVVGNIQSTAGNMLANGNITANGYLVGANANVTGEATVGSLVTSNINYSGNITISAVGTDNNINLVPGGPNGTIDMSLARVAQVGDPTQPHDAATKEYVDNLAQGLSVHTPVNVTSATNLNATYAPGGTTQTTTTISGGKTITFSANHGLSVGDEIYWTNSFNGIVANDGYFVYSTPALNQITVKAGFYGAEVTTLTNGTGLSQPSRANSGVGATLTNAGALAAIQIDGVSLSSTNRVLVQGQTNAFENGVYTVTTVGNGSTAWVLTRSSDTNNYDPKSTSGFGYGDYFFVQQGLSYAGSSYVVTTPTGEIIFGVTNIGFSQFSAAGSYSAGSGINITGTTISANVDGVTTDIIAGNIAVKTSANLITPNIGDATFSSISWNNLSNGNVSANNLSTANIANIGLDLTVGGNIQANGTISSNANVSGLNFTTNGNVQAGGNVLAANVTANSTVFASNANVSGTTITNALTVNNAITGNTANFSGNVVLPNLTVNLELAGNTANFSGNTRSNNLTVNNVITGNTANFSGNVVLPNITVNLALVGNTANFSGNVTAANANLGNLVTANFFTGTLINGTSNVAIPTTNGNVNITAGGNTSFIVTSTGANVTGNLGVSGNFNVGNLVASNLTANTAVNIGNTAITWGTVTTTSITANQTISTISVTGITGIQWLVKGLDAGGKQSVATVQAVTDGTSVDWATFGGVQLGGTTGTLAVNISGGNIQLQVTPASSNSTVWVTQYRII